MSSDVDFALEFGAALVAERDIPRYRVEFGLTGVEGVGDRGAGAGGSRVTGGSAVVRGGAAACGHTGFRGRSHGQSGGERTGGNGQCDAQSHCRRGFPFRLAGPMES